MCVREEEGERVRESVRGRSFLDYSVKAVEYREKEMDETRVTCKDEY